MTRTQPEALERRLAAILAADVAGYSVLMGADEEATLAVLSQYLGELERLIATFRGRVVGSAGDSVLAQFESPVEAVRCAQAMQVRLRELNRTAASGRAMEFRVGIHLGDVIVDGKTIYGDAVNVAARLEGLAEPGGIAVSRTVHEHVRGKIAVEFDDLGDYRVKNIAEPVHVFEVRFDRANAMGRRRRALLARLRPAHWAALGAAAVLVVEALALVVWTLSAGRIGGTLAGSATEVPTVLSAALANQPLPGRLQPGASFQLCDLCPEMTVIGIGSFLMGSSFSEAGRSENEGPQREITIVRPFAIGKFELTFAEWDACVSAGGCRTKPQDRSWGRGSLPAIYISWHDTQEYLAWLGALTGQEFRLPSEAEWEYAARAGSQTRYWWGDEIGTARAVCDGCGGQGGGKTLPVGSLPPNAFGLYDVHGNVWEWVADCWSGSLVDTPSDGSARVADDCARRTLRGGSWGVPAEDLRSARRIDDEPSLRSGKRGFRVAMTLPHISDTAR